MQTTMKQMQKPEHMPEDKIKQFQNQSESWKKQLTSMTEENIRRKKLVSLLLQHKLKEKSLEDVEEFYGRFIHADELIALLRNDLNAFGLMLRKENPDRGSVKDFKKNILLFRKNMQRAEKEFDRLKKDFSIYMMSELQQRKRQAL